MGVAKYIGTSFLPDLRPSELAKHESEIRGYFWAAIVNFPEKFLRGHSAQSETGVRTAWFLRTLPS